MMVERATGYRTPSTPRIVPVVTPRSYEAYKSEESFITQDAAFDNALHHFFFAENADPKLKGTRLGARLTRSMGMVMGGMYQATRALAEDPQAYHDPKMVDLLNSLNRFNILVDAAQTKNGVQESFPQAALGFHTASSIITELAQTYSQEDASVSLEKKCVRGFELAVKGLGQLNAFNALSEIPNFATYSLTEQNHAWTLSMLGVSREEIERYLDNSSSRMTEIVLKSVSPKEAHTQETLRDVVVVVDPDVSSTDFEQVAAFALSPFHTAMFSQEVLGKDMAAIYVSQTGHNHFSFTIDGLDYDGNQTQKTVTVGIGLYHGDIAPFFDPTGTTPINPAADEAIYAIRTAGKVDFTKPDGKQAFARSALSLARKLDNPRALHEDTFGHRDENRHLIPLHDGTPELTQQVLLAGSDPFTRDVTIIVDGKKQTTQVMTRIQGAYEYLVEHVDRLKALLSQEPQTKEIVPVSTTAALPPRRLPLFEGERDGLVQNPGDTFYTASDGPSTVRWLSTATAELQQAGVLTASERLEKVEINQRYAVTNSGKLVLL